MTQPNGSDADARLMAANARCHRDPVRWLNHRVIQDRIRAQDTGTKRVGESIQSLPGLSQLLGSSAGPVDGGIPRRHSGFVPLKDTSPAWWSKAESLYGKIGSGFMVALLGPRGTGKTQMAVGAMLLANRADMTTRYTKAIEIFLTIRATYSKTDVCELDAINSFVEPRLLVIDEIQMRGETAFEDRMLAYLIDKRYDAMADTIMIGNLTPDVMASTLDPSIVDRLCETGGVIECNWGSFRMKKNEQPKQARTTGSENLGSRTGDRVGPVD
jgi:hypothetical protein